MGEDNNKAVWWEGETKYRRHPSGAVDWVDFSEAPINYSSNGTKRKRTIVWDNMNNTKIKLSASGVEYSMIIQKPLPDKKLLVEINNTTKEISRASLGRCTLGQIVKRQSSFRSNAGGDWTDITYVPKRPSGTTLDWTKCFNTPIPFSYKDSKGIIYITHKKPGWVSYRYLERTGEISYSGITSVKIGTIVGYFSDKHSFAIGETIYGCLVLEQIRMPHSSQKPHLSKRGYILKCLWSEEYFDYTETDLKRYKRSPYIRRRPSSKGMLYADKEILRFIKDKEQAKTITRGSPQKILCLCPTCGTERWVQANNLYYDRSMGCTLCSKKISYPERFTQLFLKALGYNIQFQKEFDNLPRRYFDFYIAELNAVVEVHGKQHYQETTGNFNKFNFANVKEVDRIKQEFCEKEGIKYIEIDARRSLPDFIRESIVRAGFSDVSDEQFVEIRNKAYRDGHFNVHELAEDYKRTGSLEKAGKIHGISSAKASAALKQKGYTVKKTK